ncbi:VCBS domain-containing protein, partial [Paramagnetospirillum magnetotacticum]|uniref:VCBS domain-containing protein n=1 Tax=Paramagnetospirillum magnetotacticum TaxID=188 RepID=UPI001269F792
GDSFKVVAVDNHGAASAPSTVAVTITGSNDGPTVSVANVTTANDHTPPSPAMRVARMWIRAIRWPTIWWTATAIRWIA